MFHEILKGQKLELIRKENLKRIKPWFTQNSLPPYTVVYGYFHALAIALASGKKFTGLVRHQLRQDLGRSQHSTVAIALLSAK
ncbi:hypothetical protein I8748_28130 [Nostoc sp. CENA67]|uniref:Uncharacterized protein n=1 Tax=Amazonocrinis nigriterrae CENA67 TaxID=2794033 RepID=A0A8J7LDN5_9NOST|nr:hypothetical protein [Amazonocrinis nigriterrae]MBH8565986.1 hypothetical protein [Amazonocrinis nigriterrae CENA67]